MIYGNDSLGLMKCGCSTLIFHMIVGCSCVIFLMNPLMQCMWVTSRLVLVVSAVSGHSGYRPLHFLSLFLGFILRWC